jgi:hypothetical protein
VNEAHEWKLDEPAQIIQIYILTKNIDRWTVDGFLKFVEKGIADLENSVLVDGCRYQPWKRVGTFNSPRTKDAYGTDNSVSQYSAQPKVRVRRRKVHKS